MNPTEVEEILHRYGVLQRGHFKLSSGRHSDTYLQCALVLQHPKIAMSFGEALADRFRDHVDAVASPSLGGLLIGNAVAYNLGVRFVFAERADGDMAFRRGQGVARGERIVVVEDVITTGGSAAEVLALCQQAGAHVLGVGTLVDRSEAEPPFRLEALLKVKATTWAAEECPLCEAGEPIDSPGSRSLG